MSKTLLESFTAAQREWLRDHVAFYTYKLPRQELIQRVERIAREARTLQARLTDKPQVQAEVLANMKMALSILETLGYTVGPGNTLQERESCQ
ncbi:hypothetical protein [Gloeobacter kilaueensis]|uniref:Uncharacterized protein n=1 Tax=Gloeobacter kilaueensis (strain ATCC BAA-2537 / CCAP 1431/1 / ULC 316 / JS1) TaxID=1183438 RepID=U5QE30_GLOK1|nr:hypothetical protein [Gloeobacter kilaueensis]AGY57128.1 hypothetical protein GKIL_0882 [Gloeobacter kilaueensis JS1]